jgi:hypothetical protein
MGYSNFQRPSFSEALGQKVKHTVSMFGKAKALYETGKTLYHVAEAVAPFIPYIL